MDLKSDSHLPKKKKIICFNDNPSKMIINAFYFCRGFLGMYKNGLIRKLRLILKFMTSQSG